VGENLGEGGVATQPRTLQDSLDEAIAFLAFQDRDTAGQRHDIYLQLVRLQCVILFANDWRQVSLLVVCEELLEHVVLAIVAPEVLLKCRPHFHLDVVHRPPANFVGNVLYVVEEYFATLGGIV